MRGFGADRPVSAHALTASADGASVWAVGEGYVVDGWDVTDAAGVHIVVTNVPWMPAGPPPPRPAPRGNSVLDLVAAIKALPRRPAISVIGIDRAGRVWVDGSIPVDTSVLQSGMKHVVEILDPRTRKILASKEMPFAFGFVPGSELVASRSEDSDGFLHITIWRATLRSQ